MGKEIGDEEAFQRRRDYWLPERSRSGTAYQGAMPSDGVLEASYYLWRSKFGGMSVPDAKRLKGARSRKCTPKKLLAEPLLEMEVTREALRKK